MLHRVWKGVVGDNHMYHSSSPDGLTWTDQREIVGLTSHGPALAVFNNTLHRAWKGAGDDTKIYHSSSPDGLTWTDPQSVHSFGLTDHGPALAVWNNTLYLTWKAAGATMMSLFSRSADGRWSSPDKIMGHTSNSPALSAGPPDPETLYCLWRGADTDTRIYVSYRTDRLEFPYHKGVPLEDHLPGDATCRTSHGPALAHTVPRYLGDRWFLFALWKGEGTDTRMFMSSRDRATWYPPQQVGGQTSHRPALAPGPGGKLYRLWKNSTDTTMMISVSTNIYPIGGVEWTPKQPIAGLTNKTPSLVNL
jgi:hypothetical protein